MNILICLCLLVLFQGMVRADEAVVIPEEGLNPDRLEDSFGLLYLTRSWRYHPGDQAEWADPVFDDRSWDTLDSLQTLLKPDVLSYIHWTGNGWFRLHLTVDPSLWDQPLALAYSQMGAAEIYLDGQLIDSLGKVGHSRGTEEVYLISDGNPKMIPIRFSNQADHVIAVRYSNFWGMDHQNLAFPMGFSMALSELDNGIEQKAAQIRVVTMGQMFFSGVALAFALLHLLLFLFYPEFKENLYYAIFAGSVSGMAFAPFQAFVFLNGPGHMLAFLLIFKVALILTTLFGLRFLYHIFFGAPPRFFKILFATGILLLLFGWYIPLNYVYVFCLVTFPEVLRIVFVAIRRKIEGARIIGIGYAVFTLACFYQILLELRMLEPAFFFSLSLGDSRSGGLYVGIPVPQLCADQQEP